LNLSRRAVYDFKLVGQIFGAVTGRWNYKLDAAVVRPWRRRAE